MVEVGVLLVHIYGLEVKDKDVGLPVPVDLKSETWLSSPEAVSTHFLSSRSSAQARSTWTDCSRTFVAPRWNM